MQFILNWLISKKKKMYNLAIFKFAQNILAGSLRQRIRLAMPYGWKLPQSLLGIGTLKCLQYNTRSTLLNKLHK